MAIFNSYVKLPEGTHSAIGSMVLPYMVCHGSHQDYVSSHIPAPWIRHGICDMFLSLEDKTPEHMGIRIARRTRGGSLGCCTRWGNLIPPRNVEKQNVSCVFLKKPLSSLIGSQLSNLPKSKNIFFHNFPSKRNMCCQSSTAFSTYIYIHTYIYIYILYIYTIIYIYLINTLYIYICLVPDPPILGVL